LKVIIEEQYYLAKHANIGLLESQTLSDFERGIYADLLASDLKKESDVLKKGLA
jgi:hypothetical protein